MKSFTGVKKNSIKDYLQPTTIASADLAVIYVGVSNLPLKKEVAEKSS